MPPRKPRKPAPQAPPAPEPPSTHPDVPREARWRQPASVHQHTVRQVAEMVQTGKLRIPDFQRDFVWEDDHVLYLLDSLLRGFYVGNVTLWEQYKLPAKTVNVAGIEAEGSDHGFLVVDGQQRIGSIARALLTKRYAFDFLTLKFVVASEPRKDLVPLHILHGAGVHAVLAGIKEDLWSAEQAGWLQDNLIYRQVCATVLPYGWEIGEVMEMFGRMNTTGVRMDAHEVEAALQKARKAA